ncbi:MAG: ABC-F type ribosomal protection protein [Eubacteriales bacterium]|nr:ABC-F type ribosomal protection protein [Eubacteriales bacterium]
MALLTASNITKSFGDALVFKDVSFGIEDTDKIGLIGVNGAGKTTLFKTILGLLPPDSGDVYIGKTCKIGYLKQHADINSNRSVYGELMSVFSHLAEIEKELEKIAQGISGGDHSLIARQQELSEEFERKGGYTYKSRVRGTLAGLGFSESDFDLNVSALSGGQRTRLMLAKVLMSDANLLFLDEPTNHLDISSVEWLENFLRSYGRAVVIISHDRYFLDRVTNKTFELENSRLTIYDGNYSYYIKKKAEDTYAQKRAYENTIREIRRIEKIVQQQRQWNRERNIRAAESKQKMIERLEKNLEAPMAEPENIRFKFDSDTISGNDVLSVSSAAMSYGKKHLFSNVDMFIKKGERVFLLGPNGCGKTTLLKMIAGKIQGKSGEIKLGANVRVGYFDQIQGELDPSNTVIDEVWNKHPHMTQTEIRNALAAFLFKGDDVNKKIEALSGGEKARISLLKLMLSKDPFLVLDEPTNHLDIKSREVLEGALLNYDGTVLVVSHDRYLINKLANKIYYMTNGGLEKYEGNYDYFLEKHKTASASTTESKPKINDYELRKKAQAAKRKIENQIKRVEEEIAQVEKDIESLETELAKPHIATDFQKAMDISKEVESLRQKLDGLYERWGELHE